ncbi:uncharacterized protein [Equus przewalskii]|uniref:Uncharacterized protein isoform X2 n=1 Tax=Equus przewalskii TaxID=9798 RepID=A0ABM4Q3F4_EQUPR
MHLLDYEKDTNTRNLDRKTQRGAVMKEAEGSDASPSGGTPMTREHQMPGDRQRILMEVPVCACLMENSRVLEGSLATHF